MLFARSLASYALNGFLAAVARRSLLRAAQSGDISGLRKQALAMGQRFTRMPAGISRSEDLIDSVPVTWLSAPDVKRETVLLYLHGGGFVMPALGMHYAFCARAALSKRLHVAMPHYRLAPEHPFPAAPEDCFAAYKGLLEQGHAAENIVIAGDSAGGNLVLAVLLMAKQAQLPLPAGASLISPGLMLQQTRMAQAGYQAADPMFLPQTLSCFQSLYCGSDNDPPDPRLTPLSGEFSGLPPLQIYVGGAEMLRVDAQAAADKARASGVPTQFTLVEGMPHVFPLIDILPEARIAREHIFSFLHGRLAATESS